MMVVDEYLKYKPMQAGALGDLQDCPMNTPRQASKPFQISLNAMSNQKLPPLCHNSSVESLEAQSGSKKKEGFISRRETFRGINNSNQRLKIDCTDLNGRNKSSHMTTFEFQATNEEFMPECESLPPKKILQESSSHNDTTLRTAADTTGIHSMLQGNK